MNMNLELIEYLQRLPLFKEANLETLGRLVDESVLHVIEKDGLLIRKGDISESLFIIRKGWVKLVSITTAGKEIMLNQLGPGQIIGEEALLDQAPRSVSAIAIRPVEAIEIKYTDFSAALEENPDLALALVKIAFERLQFTTLYIEKATEWSHYIAEGNYEAVQTQLNPSQNTVVDMNQANEIRIGALLSAFFKMVNGVKKREEALKQQLTQFKIDIDDQKKKRDLDNVLNQSMFTRAREAAAEMRRRRGEPPKDEEKPSE